MNVYGAVWYASCQECNYEYEPTRIRYVPQTYNIDYDIFDFTDEGLTENWRAKWHQGIS